MRDEIRRANRIDLPAKILFLWVPCEAMIGDLHDYGDINAAELRRSRKKFKFSFTSHSSEVIIKRKELHNRRKEFLQLSRRLPLKGFVAHLQFKSHELCIEDNEIN